MTTQPSSQIHNFGFVRVAAAIPRLHLAHPADNARVIEEMAGQAYQQGVDLLVFPELSLTGYSCGDLFLQSVLLNGAWEALTRLVGVSAQWPGMTLFVGLPIRYEDRLYNCAAAVQNGRLLGIVPKIHLPNYNEFYEQRHFTSGRGLTGQEWKTEIGSIPFGTDLIFELSEKPHFRVGVEICEDLWVPNPPSGDLAQNGANVIVNLSASNAVVGKAPFRRVLVGAQSGRCLVTYIYVSSGVLESTTDLVFDGDSMIYENGSCLAASRRFSLENELIVADTDLAKIESERLKFKTFGDGGKGSYRIIQGSENGLNPQKSTETELNRPLDPHPFVPAGSASLAERCHEIFQTQVSGLCTRVGGRPFSRWTIGVSGGLDSTLALLVCCKAADRLGIERSRIDGVTMPGFGTTGRTLGNAQALMGELGTSRTQVDIRPLCLEQMRSLGHKPFGIDLAKMTLEEFQRALSQLQSDKLEDLVFENVQARVRTSFLMNRGFVVGTGDLSEAALGWCTYNADHMSMYNPNCSIPKTLVKFLVRWVAENEFTGKARDILLDICHTPISPELLPVRQDGSLVQETEKSVGPYELHDFFLFHFLRYGASPEKILYLASQVVFDKTYSNDEIQHWLGVFLKRFFSQQFKRSCVPDGPKVGTISLSPRGDWRMPSDADPSQWLKDLQKKI